MSKSRIKGSKKSTNGLKKSQEKTIKNRHQKVRKSKDARDKSKVSKKEVKVKIEDDDIEEFQEPTKKVNELISDEEKKKIESYYHLDLKFVDQKKVKKNITIADKIYRCQICQTSYPRLDKCQVIYLLLLIL